jgi:2-oxoglutarate ferredoxin oxidoreductase subunit gamma
MANTTQQEVIITGFGGQGIILTGAILGKAATIGDDRHATMTQSYGPEARGGSCSSQVIVSEGEIAFPYAENPQMVICMSQEGFTKNKDFLVSGGLLIWDTNLVETDGWTSPGIAMTSRPPALPRKWATR